jgi:hypothetical protein
MHEMMKDADMAREELVARITHGVVSQRLRKIPNVHVSLRNDGKAGRQALKTEIIDKWVENLGHCSGAISRSPIC